MDSFRCFSVALTARRKLFASRSGTKCWWYYTTSKQGIAMNYSEISLNLIGRSLQQLSTFSIKTYTMKKNDSLVELKLL